MDKLLDGMLVSAGVMLAGCETMPGQSASTAAAAPSLPSGYTCCNLHYENDWISDANWSSMPMIPAGASIKVLDYGRYRIMTEIDGRKMREIRARLDPFRLASVPGPLPTPVRPAA